MKSCSRFLVAMSVAAILILPVACDKSDPTAPDQSTLVLDANPTNLILDDGETGRSTIIATVLDGDGGPLSGFVVHFTTNSGSLNSDGDGVKTNSDGEARDVLTLRDVDEDATVTARARGAGADTVSVTITAPGQNIAPNSTIATPSGNPTIVPGGQVNFTGSGSDPDGNLPLRFAWNFGGGATNSTLEDPGNVTFSNAGVYSVTFTVTDSLGLADASPDTRTVTVAANQAPNGTITSPPGGTASANVGVPVSFAGSGTDADNDLPLTYFWDFDGGATNTTVQNPSVTFNTASTYTVSFTVTDSRGLADSTPDTLVLTVNP